MEKRNRNQDQTTSETKGENSGSNEKKTNCR